MSTPPIAWHPTPELLRNSQMAQYMAWLRQEYKLNLQTYAQLHAWSVDNVTDFWASVWRYMNPSVDASHHSVLSEKTMPGAQWFEGARFNFAKNLLRPCFQGKPKRVAVVTLDEERNRKEITADGLMNMVHRLQIYLKKQNVRAGDCVAGIVCNDEKALAAMLAATSLGAIWCSCSPEFGSQALVDRLGQVKPKVLFAVNGYTYNSKEYDIVGNVKAVLAEVKSIEQTVWIPKISKPSARPKHKITTWKERMAQKIEGDLTFVPLPFSHPVYILFSSGTTGKPKGIVHSAGGVLLQHFKELHLHADIGPDSVFTYYTTTGWMMWNWLVSGLMTGAKLVLYEGSPSYPSLERLWRMIENEQITHLGTSAKFLSTCRTERLAPKRLFRLDSLTTIFSTGSVLVEEDFDWVYAEVKKNVRLQSIAGGTDIISCFVLGNPISPIYRGEIQGKGLGMDIHAFSPEGKPVVDQKGELVCVQPTPSMPVYFVGDPDGTRYREAYFSTFDHVWTHGDYVIFNPRGGCKILGRSDTTLNPGGVRIGTAEIYRQLEQIPQIVDSLVTSLPKDGDEEVIALVVLPKDQFLSPDLRKAIFESIRKGASPRHVPKHLFHVSSIPYTMSGKKVELAVKKILMGESIENRDALKNPEALEEIEKIAKSL
jgi:acetoacetyl-CoA synthetase